MADATRPPPGCFRAEPMPDGSVLLLHTTATRLAHNIPMSPDDAVQLAEQLLQCARLARGESPP